MPNKRRRSSWGYHISGVDLRHERAIRFDDDAVLQVSQYEWMVKSAAADGLQYTVTFNEDLTEKVERPYKMFCEACMEVYDEDSTEYYCSECDICACYYTCNCPDEHGLCKHIQKVHSMTKRLIDEQGPKTLKKTTEEELATCNVVCEQVLTERGINRAEQEELLADLRAVVNKYCYKIRIIRITP